MVVVQPPFLGGTRTAVSAAKFTPCGHDEGFRRCFVSLVSLFVQASICFCGFRRELSRDEEGWAGLGARDANRGRNPE